VWWSKTSWSRVWWKETKRTLSHRWPGHLKCFLFGLGYRLRYKSEPQPPISRDGFDFVTVVYEQELLLLDLQARSLNLYLDAGFSGEIIVIVNDLKPAKIIERIRREILPHYGRWQSHVRLLPFYRLGAGLNASNGWVFQQALKIAIARHVATRFFVVLDAKNHAIKPVSAGHFISPEGRCIQRLTHKHEPLREYTQTCAQYFGLTPTGPLDPCPPSTPFVMHTQSARELIAYVEQKERRCFFAFFKRTPHLSEFIFYGFFLRVIKRETLDEIYEDGGPSLSRTVWPNGWGLKQAMEEASRRPAIRFFAVHREILKSLPESAHSDLLAFWKKFGLLDPDETLHRAAGCKENFVIAPHERVT